MQKPGATPQEKMSSSSREALKARNNSNDIIGIELMPRFQRSQEFIKPLSWGVGPGKDILIHAQSAEGAK